MDEPLVLGIETSCDETGIALVRGRRLLADVTASSMEDHARFGGIIPEIASRAHLEVFAPTLDAALTQAEVDLGDIDAIAVTAGPGLVGALTVGLSAAKALAVGLEVPLYGVNHIIGHLAVDELANGAFPDHFIGLVVSGGHTNLFEVRDIARDVTELGHTLDDAAGEAFDKVGRLLGLPYPGGPHIDRLSKQGDPAAINFPRGLSRGRELARHPYNFSFSGVKTAVARYIEELTDSGKPLPTADIAASFSEAVVEVLVTKSMAACTATGATTLVVGGGFSANSRLRELITAHGEAHGVQVRIPAPRYCTDNGAMIAALGSALTRAGVAPSALDIPAASAMDLSQIRA